MSEVSEKLRSIPAAEMPVLIWEQWHCVLFNRRWVHMLVGSSWKDEQVPMWLLLCCESGQMWASGMREKGLVSVAFWKIGSLSIWYSWYFCGIQSRSYFVLHLGTLNPVSGLVVSHNLMAHSVYRITPWNFVNWEFKSQIQVISWNVKNGFQASKSEWQANRAEITRAGLLIQIPGVTPRDTEGERRALLGEGWPTLSLDLHVPVSMEKSFLEGLWSPTLSSSQTPPM